MRISDWSSDVCSSDLVFQIGLLGGDLSLELDGEGAVVRVVIRRAEEGVEDRVAVEARQAPPDDAAVEVDERRHRAVADEAERERRRGGPRGSGADRKSTRLNSSH